MRSVTIGTGSGFAGSRVEHALDLLHNADLNYLVFETLGERTVAAAQLSRFDDESKGYNPLLRDRMLAILPIALEKGVRIVTNMGGANPRAAAEVILDVARELGLRAPRVAVILGDDVRGALVDRDASIAPSGRPVGVLGERLIAANAYIGVAGIVRGLADGADVVIGGRIADPSLFLGCMVHEFGWDLADHDIIGKGTVVGHLLECSSQVTGGYLADPGVVDVQGLDRIGFPLAEVFEDGTAIVSKPDGTGGEVTVDTCRLQLLYEVADPAAYLTPDVTADFTSVRFEQVGENRVRVTGGSGSTEPVTLKVTVGYLDGFLAEAEISYGGPGCIARARLAEEILRTRIERDGIAPRKLQFDLIGWDSLFGPPADGTPEPPEVRLRVAAWCDSAAQADEVGREVEALYASGPGGGGGVRRSVSRRLVVEDSYIPREDVRVEMEFA